VCGQGLAALPAAFHLGTHRLEIHKPRLEQGARHRLQRFVLFAVEFDLVVQRAEDMGDGALFGDGWYPPDLQDTAVQTVLQQAEALSSGWSISRGGPI